MILILDFGSQYTQLIARRIRELHVYCEIQPYDLPLQVSDSRVNQINGKSLSDVERLHVKSVLEETGWNVYQAARLLQIDRVTLYNKIKKYGFKRTA